MADRIHISIYGKPELAGTSVRAGERKLGQDVQLLFTKETSRFSKALAEATRSGARYALLGVPEDIGPRANLGRPGADKAWEAFLQFFLNMQSNQFVATSTILLIGHVELSDIKQKEKEKSASENIAVSDLRKLCAEIDDRVCPIVQHVVEAGLEPIVIGGGNNNSYPTIKGLLKALRDKRGDDSLQVATVNCDPHADFRLIEGRHSGNPFTYADKDGLLKAYCVLAAHENFNSQDMIERMAARSYPLFYWEEVVRGQKTWEEQVGRVIEYLSRSDAATGLELDLDGIKNMPCSAKTPFGITEEQAFYFVYSLASVLDTQYLHLSEAAPQYAEDGLRIVGKVLAKLVVEYVRGREAYRGTEKVKTSQVAAQTNR